MPQKPLEWRKKIAKRQGAARRLKPIDLPGKVSAHAAKKSRYSGIPAGEEGRSVGVRAPPHQGRSKQRKFERPSELPAPDRRGAKAANVLEPHRLQKTTVRGRKKPPSQMHLKREGGPQKRSPLHGG